MDAKKAYHISTAGEIKEISPANGKDFKLAEEQKIVSEYVEVVHITKHIIAIVDEEGKIKGREPNRLATIIANSAYGIMQGDYLAGDVIICPSQMFR